MLEFFCVALLAGCFLLLSVIADVLSRIYDILDCWDDEYDEDDSNNNEDAGSEEDAWPEPDLYH